MGTRPFRELSDELRRKLDICPASLRVDDATKHSWRFDGDDPYIGCAYCGQVRDAIDGRVLTAVLTGSNDPSGGDDG